MGIFNAAINFFQAMLSSLMDSSPGVKTPISVIMPEIRSAGVTSKAGFQT